MQSISCYTSRTFGLRPGPGCAALCREHRGSPARPAGEAGACSGCGRTGATVGPTCRPGPRSLSRSRAGAGGTAWDGVQARDLVRTVHECSPPRPRPPCPPLGGSAGHSASAPLPAPVPPPRVGLTSGGKPRPNFLRLNTPFAGWLPLGPWARSRKPRCRNPASGRPKRAPSSHQAREAQALACGSHSSSSPSGSARGAAHRGLRDPAPRPTQRPVPGGTGPARRQAVTGRGRAPWRAVPRWEGKPLPMALSLADAGGSAAATASVAFRGFHPLAQAASAVSLPHGTFWSSRKSLSPRSSALRSA